MGGMSKVAVGALALSGCTAPETALHPSEQAIEQHAAKCGIKPNQLQWTVDSSGRRFATITPNGDPDSLSPTALTCVLEWAKQSGAKVGFLSEPPPDRSDP